MEWLTASAVETRGAQPWSIIARDRERAQSARVRAYVNPGPPVGNDGTITITFSSPTTGTADLPGGRHIQIERYFKP
jgi:hypothetical protein